MRSPSSSSARTAPASWRTSRISSNSVESQNLQTQGRVPESVVAEIAAVARTLSVPAPPSVLSAKSGPRLHEALLSWQGMLLDALRPHRLSYGDRFD